MQFTIFFRFFCMQKNLKSDLLVLRAQSTVCNNFGCFEKLWSIGFVLCRRKIHISIFRWPTWIFVSNLIHFVQNWKKNVLWLREWFSEAESASIRSASKFCFDLDVRIFFNFSKNIFSVDPKMGILFFQRNPKSLKQLHPSLSKFSALDFLGENQVFACFRPSYDCKSN